MEAKREKQTPAMRRRLRRAPLVLLDLTLFGTMLLGVGALHRLHDFGGRGHWIKYVLDLLSSWSNSLGFGQLGFIGVIALIAVSAWLCFTIAHYLFAEDSFTNTLPWEQDEVNTRAIPNIAAQVLPMVPYYQRIPRDTSGVVFRSVQWVFNPAGWIVTLSNFIRLEILSVINRALDYCHIPGASAGRPFRMVMSGFFSLILLLPLRGLERLINAPSDMIRYFYPCLPSRRKSREATSDYTRLNNPPLAIVYQGDAPLPEGSYGADNTSHIPRDFELKLGDENMPQALWIGKNNQLQSQPPSEANSTNVRYEQVQTDGIGGSGIISIIMLSEDGTEIGSGTYERNASIPLSYASQRNAEDNQRRETNRVEEERQRKAREEQELLEESRLDRGAYNLEATAGLDKFAALIGQAQGVGAYADAAEAKADAAEAKADAAEAKAEGVAAAQATMQTQLLFLMQQLGNHPLPSAIPSPITSSVAMPLSSLAAPAAAFFPSAGNDGGGAPATAGDPSPAAPGVAQAPTPEPFS